MQRLSDTIIAIVSRRAGISDRDLANAIYGRMEQQLVNGECRLLANTGRVVRRQRADGVIGNFLE